MRYLLLNTRKRFASLFSEETPTMFKSQSSPSTAADNLAILEQAAHHALQSLSQDGTKNTEPQRTDALNKFQAVIVKRLDLGLPTD